MRIVYFYQYFGTAKGGWSTRVHEFTKRWVAAGHQVTVVTTIYDKSDLKADGFISKQQIDGIDLIVINLKISNKHSKLYRIWTFVAYAILSVFYALRLNYDVAIASSGPIFVGLSGLAAKYVKRKLMIFEVRDLWPEGAVQLGLLRNKMAQRVAFWFEKKCYLAATHIVALSEGMADSIRTRFNLDNVHVVTNASDNELFDQNQRDFALPEWAENRELFLYAGSLGLMDNCVQIVNAAKLLSEKGNAKAMFVLIGEGQEREGLQKTAKAYGLNNIRFLGLLPKTEVVGWLSNARAALMTFKDINVLNTSSPNKMFDAFAAGLPLIQNTQGWMKTLLDKSQCGITVKQNDAGSFAAAIELLQNNTSLRNQMAKNAKGLALDEFDREKLAGSMLKLLQDATK